MGGTDLRPNCSKTLKPGSSLGDIGGRVARRIGQIAFSARFHSTPREISDDYVVSSDVLGSGFNGNIVMATSRLHPEERFAVKSFSLDGIDKEKLDVIKAEVEVHLSLDHPHIARLVDVYESSQHVHLVMDCLEGGELFDRLTEKKKFTEDESRTVVRQVLLALNYLHGQGIVHRDVKLENCVYERKGGDHLKLIDFGFSQIWSRDSSENMTRRLGTLSYIAPEVLAKNYTSQCDLWSLGVTCFILLSGKMPFYGTDHDMKRAISAGKYSMQSAVWGNVSSDARHFVTSLLQIDPSKRLTAKQALEHPWMASHLLQGSGLVADVVGALRQFRRAPTLTRGCMRVLALSVSGEELAEMRDAFFALSSRGQGTITFQDLKNAIVDDMQACCHREALEVFEALDYNLNKQIHYSHFLAAMLGSRLQLSDASISTCFRRLDTDSSGSITEANLVAMFGNFDGSAAGEFIKAASQSKDGGICLDEFTAFLRSSASETTQAGDEDLPQRCQLGNVIESLESYPRRLLEETVELTRVSGTVSQPKGTSAARSRWGVIARIAKLFTHLPLA